MSPATQFLSAFNSIESHLRDALKAKNSDGFTWMVRLAAKKKIITEAQSRSLQEFAELRNAIVHGDFSDGHAIADPRPDTITHIESIRDAIVAPVTVLDVVGAKDVQHLTPQSSILKALTLIRDSTISQFPLYEGGKFVGLLTTNTIARWVANDLDDNNHLDAVTIADALKYAEHAEHVEFFPRDVTAAHAVATFMQPGSAQFAIITENGRPHEKPLRAVGRSDLALLHQALISTP
ncbi:CBS domain protein [Corynebacterium kalinowskii]|uniref:CBS domain protein n=2 Tax=Corynebacterium kalinowskii TaxID=2675216 RepID=A0A6B8W3W5_9CORY|nr:CBS domain protein [Corynebacterium kalinowskii]